MKKLPPFLFLALSGSWVVAAPVDFSREVLPILSENCLACHGQDEAHRKAGLRLDVWEGATADHDGARAIVPGNPGESELIKRVVSTDPEEVMPTPKSHKPPLSAGQVEVLRRWIAEGAVWGKHWSFELPRKLPLPDSTAHPVDAWVRAHLETESLAPSKEASRQTLIRRLSSDLTGLPPKTAEVKAFLNNRSPDAYEKLVKCLLESPHYGERMAMWWLDVARYSDTDGFAGDSPRSNWPWRDWVVAAFNTNMHFDQFTVEQFAGDLLPSATPEQKLATCFHRNHMTNGEGGRDPEESRVDYVIDRVNTIGSAWLGLTLGCCQCHSHKFDPISHADYYSLSAFFNSIDEDGRAGGGAKPSLPYHSPHAARAVQEAARLVEQRQADEAMAREAADKPFNEWLAVRVKEVQSGFSPWHVLQAVALASREGTVLEQAQGGVVTAAGSNPRQDDYVFTTPLRLPGITGLRLEVLPHEGLLGRGKSGEFILTDFKAQVRRRGHTQVRDILLASAIADYSSNKKEGEGYGDIRGTLDDDPRNGWTTRGAPSGEEHTAVFALAEPLTLAPDETLVLVLLQRSTEADANIARFRLSATDQPGETVRSLSPSPLEDLAAAHVRNAAEIQPELRARLLDQFLLGYVPHREAKAALDRARRQLAEVRRDANQQNVMVLAERPQPRETFVLERGVWDKHGARVQRGVPATIAPWPELEEKTRLGLARWIVSRQNPLTARVIVNQLWQMLFGAGLVRTPEDFGLQGERPTHPELLDWLAVEFMESGWDVKHLISLIVTSATYRQDSAISPALLSRDPENRLLARGARFRLPSWMLRDAALHDSGLLNLVIGGPPVKPPQPDGVWDELFKGRYPYEPSEGPARYRRTLYTFWRRSIAPTFLFDNAQRRTCDVRISRSNTPLHALTLLNDQAYVEASIALASAVLSGPGEVTARLRSLSEQILSRTPDESQMATLVGALEHALAYYRKHPQAASALLTNTDFRQDATLNVSEIAAYALVASTLLNLDEAITHE